MGTRNLLKITCDGALRVAQYGQYDGYPAGVGQDLFNRLTDILCDGEKLKLFKERLGQCVFARSDNNMVHNYTSVSSEIIQKLLDSADGLTLLDSRQFEYDTTFCEYVYDLNMDNKTLVVTSPGHFFGNGMFDHVGFLKFVMFYDSLPIFIGDLLHEEKVMVSPKTLKSTLDVVENHPDTPAYIMNEILSISERVKELEEDNALTDVAATELYKRLATALFTTEEE